MLDTELAKLYGVTKKRFREQVRRNLKRFPPDFMFQLTFQEVGALTPHFAASIPGRGGRRSPSMAFTEHGVAMLSSVLNSERAIEVNIAIMRTFSRLRELIVSHKDLAQKLAALEEKYDGQFRVVFDAIRQLMSPAPTPAKRRIGFR